MGLAEDLTAEVVKILKENWTTRDGKKVPETPDLGLSNDAMKLSGTVLYADLADSTGLVASHKPEFAAEIYKVYLNCACRLIRSNGGEITAFDGDRVMAVFLGETKNTSAMKTALQINHAVAEIINPKIREIYTTTTFSLKQVVGIDTSDLFVARTGIRGSNDLVWVGNAANRAAKLCSLRTEGISTWVTAAVFDAAHESAKLTANRAPMWERRTWTAQSGTVIYGSAQRLKP